MALNFLVRPDTLLGYTCQSSLCPAILLPFVYILVFILGISYAVYELKIQNLSRKDAEARKLKNAGIRNWVYFSTTVVFNFLYIPLMFSSAAGIGCSTR
jgi:hypothetical protein